MRAKIKHFTLQVGWYWVVPRKRILEWTESFAQFLWDTIKTVAKEIFTRGVRWFQNASNNPHLCLVGEMVLTGYDIVSLISAKKWVNAATKLIEFAWKGEVGLVNVPDVHKCYGVGKEIVGILREKFYFSRRNLLELTFLSNRKLLRKMCFIRFLDLHANT